MADAGGLARSMNGGVSVFTRVGLYAVGAKLAVDGELSVAALIGASMLGSYAVQKASMYVQARTLLAKAEAALHRVNEFTALGGSDSRSTLPASFSGGLVLEDISLAYGDDNPVFADLNLTLPAGGVLVVQGYNGSGKTTLARLLAGLLEPTQGRILLDSASGDDLSEISRDWWRKHVAYMPQEPFFLDGTIRDNICFVGNDIEPAKLSHIVEAADLRKFLDESMKGMDTPVFGGGRLLPLGIRRRLALARALAGEGRLAVFDEPTEGLDGKGVQAVYAILNTLASEGHTLVVFTHDSNIAKGATHILDLSTKPAPEVRIVQPVESDDGGTS